MLRSPSGRYTSRCWPRASSVVTTPMCSPVLIYENINRFPFSTQVNDDAFLSINRGSPPSTGTSHSSHGPTTLYAMRVPSGENVGDNFVPFPRVNCTGSPEGNNFTYTSPGPKKVSLPRRNTSSLPSGESPGYTAESVKNVICSHFPLFFGVVSTPRQYTKPAIAASAAAPIPAAQPNVLPCFPPPFTVVGAVFPVSVSRRSRCRSTRISAALW